MGFIIRSTEGMGGGVYFSFIFLLGGRLALKIWTRSEMRRAGLERYVASGRTLAKPRPMRRARATS